MSSPAGSGMSLARVRILSAQSTCESLSRPSSSCHTPHSSSFKTCSFKRLLLLWADLEDVVFFGQRTKKAAFVVAHVALSLIGKASYTSSAVFPDFNLLKNATIFLSSIMVVYF